MKANLEIVIAGGGAAGWLTACYLQRMLGARAPGAGALTITVIGGSLPLYDRGVGGCTAGVQASAASRPAGGS